MAAEKGAEHGLPPNLDKVAAEVRDFTCLYDTAWGAAPNDQHSKTEVIEDDEVEQELANRLADTRFEKTTEKRLPRKLLLLPLHS